MGQTKKPRTSKSKKRTDQLAPDFRERLIEHATAAAKQHGAQWLTPLCIVAACGCRPVELEKGVVVRKGEKPGTLEFVIRGAKVNDRQRRGIPVRRVTVRTRRPDGTDQPWAAHLRELTRTEPVRFRLASPTSFSNKVREASLSLWPRRKAQASPYSFRHALAADMKTAGVEPVSVAKVLGHASTRSQEAYGWKKRRGSQAPEVSAETSAEPRQSSRMDRYKIATKVRKAAMSVPDRSAFASKLGPVAQTPAASPSGPRSARRPGRP